MQILLGSLLSALRRMNYYMHGIVCNVYYYQLQYWQVFAQSTFKRPKGTFDADEVQDIIKFGARFFLRH